ncbi:MAG TPA: DedA family protein [Streptosporangiaceae bacterium]|jgi:membrane protein DedA with SNARE-associated domain
MSLSLINHLLQSYGYIAVFAFVALESLGIPLPGETTLIAASVYAGSTHRLNIAVVFMVAAAAAIVGDNAGYWVGRTGGQRLAGRYGRFVRLDATKLAVGRYLFARHGGTVVFFGRFVTVLRTYAAFFAGLNSMRWPRFTVFNAAGGVVWSAVFAFGAFGLGAAATGVGQSITLIGLGISAAATVAGILLARRWMHRLEQRALAAEAAVVKAPGKERPAMIGPGR